MQMRAALLEHVVTDLGREAARSVTKATKPVKHVHEWTTGTQLEGLHAHTAARLAAQPLCLRVGEPFEQALEMAVFDCARACAWCDERPGGVTADAAFVLRVLGHQDCWVARAWSLPSLYATGKLTRAQSVNIASISSPAPPDFEPFTAGLYRILSPEPLGRPTGPCVHCVSRLPPVSFYRYDTVPVRFLPVRLCLHRVDMPSALASFLKAARTHRSVYLDVGANDGADALGVWRQLCGNGRPAAEAQLHLMVLVEAQPRFVELLHNLAVNLTQRSEACDIEVVGAAAWTHDGTVAFSQNRDPRSAYVGSHRQYGQRKVLSVPAVDFGAYLNRTLREDDNAMLKLDIERAEFDLLPWWLTTRSLCLVDYFLIEWHFKLLDANSSSARLEGLGLRLALASILERGCPPRPSGLKRLLQHDELQLSRHYNIPGLWERARWHNGQPTLPMPWSNLGVISTQSSRASEAPTSQANFTAGADTQLAPVRRYTPFSARRRGASA